MTVPLPHCVTLDRPLSSLDHSFPFCRTKELDCRTMATHLSEPLPFEAARGAKKPRLTAALTAALRLGAIQDWAGAMCQYPGMELM